MRKLVYEEPIVPVFIDRDEELQAYYSCAEDLGKEPLIPQQHHPNPTAPGYYPPSNQYQPAPQWQGYAYPPQSAAYPPAGAQPSYPGYPPNQAYNPYPPANPYGPPQPTPYGAPSPQYPGYGYPPASMPQAQAGWPGYSAPYGGYGHQPQPIPYQQGYPQYPRYNYPAPAASNPEEVKPKHRASEHSAGPGSEVEVPAAQSQSRTWGWSEALYSDLNDYGKDQYNAYSNYASAGQAPVQETVTSSISSRDYVYDHYAKQFDQMRIGWNV